MVSDFPLSLQLFCLLLLRHPFYLCIFAALIKQGMIKKLTAAITAVGGYVPEDKLTNFDLEKMVDTNDEWIRTRTGIKERRILKGAGKATSDMVVPAVKAICEKRGIHPE